MNGYEAPLPESHQRVAIGSHAQSPAAVRSPASSPWPRYFPRDQPNKYSRLLLVVLVSVEVEVGEEDGGRLLADPFRRR